MSNLIVVDYPAASTTYVCPAQIFSANTSLVFSYQINNAFQFRFDGHQRIINMTSASNIATVTFTLRGYNVYGAPITDTITGINNSTVASTLEFALLTSITPGTNASNPAFTVSVGMTDVGTTQWIPLDGNRKFFQTSLQGVVTGAGTPGDIEYTVSATLDPAQTYANGKVVFNTSAGNFFGFPLTANETYPGSDPTGSLFYLTSPVTAVQAVIADLSAGSFKFTILQQGE